jgi:hypothetical protein
MVIHHMFNSLNTKTWRGLVLALMLTACSTEENYTGSLDGSPGAIGGGVVQGTLQNVTLSWVAPVEREDGTPISMSEIAGYRIYYGETEGDYINEVDVHDRDTMQFTLKDLPEGTYYIVVTALDMDGRESRYSETIMANV